MEGKNKKKGSFGKVMLIVACMVLTAIISVSITLAWFFDKDWASHTVTMAGAVGITLKDNTNTVTSGAGNLHFNITTNYVYPGQSIDVSVKAFNDSTVNPATAAVSKGSPCYVRASFRIYTDIGKGEGASRPGEIEANAQAIYDFLFGLIKTINHDHSTSDYAYRWVYFRHYGSQALDSQNYFEGTGSNNATNNYDKGYFYLCYDLDGSNNTYAPLNGGSAITITNRDALYPLPVGTGAAFLWNGQFVMPWQITNYTADKSMFVVVEFQAIQTFIPQVTAGSISSAINNQVAPNDCTFYNPSVQTVFNSCAFSSQDLTSALESVFGSGESNIPLVSSLPSDSYTNGKSYAVYPGGEGSAVTTNTVRMYNADGTQYTP